MASSASFNKNPRKLLYLRNVDSFDIFNERKWTFGTQSAFLINSLPLRKFVWTANQVAFSTKKYPEKNNLNKKNGKIQTRISMVRRLHPRS